jgi:four helix bundle protein
MSLPIFDHENLRVYQAALEFVGWSTSIISDRKLRGPVVDQLDRASVSIALDIAEGNGKFSSKDRCRFFDIARGSALECASCLYVLVVKQLIPLEDAQVGKSLIQSVVSMLVGLIRSQSDRVYEEREEYL